MNVVALIEALQGYMLKVGAARDVLLDNECEYAADDLNDLMRDLLDLIEDLKEFTE